MVAFIDNGHVLAERPGCEPFDEGPSVDAEHRWALGAHGRRSFALDPIGLCTDVPFGFSGFVAAVSVKLTRRKVSGVQTQRWRISRGNTGASVTRLVGRPTSGDALGPHALPELPQRDPPLSARHGTPVATPRRRPAQRAGLLRPVGF